jgi:glycosyltransferase involved in cell wall biosynthesis
MISVIVLTKNEEKNIEACLNTLKWADEVILIDDHSTDKTQELAKKIGAKIFERDLNNDFAAQRNYGLEKAKGNWVFFVDADERVSPQLRAEIKSVTSDQWSVISGYYLKRKDFLFGKELKHGETAKIKLLRLAKREAGQWKRKVDEVWEIEGEVGTLKNSLIHYSHPSMTQFLESVNFKSTLNARVFYEEGKRTRLVDWLKPKAKFFQNWILRLGFLDGMEGLTMALMMSFHSFLVRSKLYLLWKQEGGWK